MLRSLILVTLARRHLRRRALRPEVRGSLPPASIVVPAFNEAVGIERSLRSLVASEYPDFDVLVVDDGSTDRTAEIVRELPDPKIRLVSQANLGKAAALQTGISATAHPIVVTVDADTIFQPSTLRALVEPFVDPKVGAVSGNTKVGNRRGLIGRWQHIEYVIGFNLDRRAFDVLDCITTVPGAVGAFRREALESVGGFSEDTLAEDTDVTMALNRAGWRVSYEDRAIAWTEAPATWSELWKQRYRWAYGTMQSIWKHRGALRRGEGHLRRALPYVLFFNVITPLFAPIIDLFALYGLVFLNPWLILAYWGGLNVLQLGVAVYAFRLDGERLRPLWAFPLQQLLYRQVMYLVMVQSAVSAFQGIRLGWHKLTRTGSVEVTS